MVDRCSFCGKSQQSGVRLVAGPEVAICEECVELAVEVLQGPPEPDPNVIRVRRSAVMEARAVPKPPAG